MLASPPTARVPAAGWRVLSWSVAMLAALLLFSSPVSSAHARPTPPRRLPAFVLAGAADSVRSDSLAGHWTLVDFWASWCGPCRRSFPWLAGLEKRYADRGVRVLAINLDKDRALAARFLAEQPASPTVAYDPAGRTAEALGVSAMPSSFLVAPDGTVQLSHAGFDAAWSREVEARLAAEAAR